MVAVNNVEWEQGEDFVMHLVYKENDTPVDLTNYEVRMDIGVDKAPGIVLTLNSADLTGLDDQGNPVDSEGPADNEITVDEEGNIDIFITRYLTLPGGVIGNRLATGNTFVYDLFVRDTAANRQKKLAKGSITVNKSVTLWN